MTIVRALIVHPDGVAETRDVEPKLAVLQELVGGWVEVSRLPPAGEVLMFGNEEAAIVNLPPNMLATRIIEALAQQPMWPPGNVMRGVLVFFAPGSAGGDFEVADCPQPVIDLAHALT